MDTYPLHFGIRPQTTPATVKRAGSYAENKQCPFDRSNADHSPGVWRL